MHGWIIPLYMSALLEWAGSTWRVALSSVCGRVRFPPVWSSGTDWWRTLADHDLWFVWAGRGTMEIDATTIPLGAGTCIWMRPGRRYVTTHHPDDPLGVNYFHFNLLDRRGRRANAPTLPGFEHTVVRHFSFADAVMQRILEVRMEPEGSASADRLFGALLLELGREAAHVQQIPAGLSRDNVERMNAAAARIRADLATPLTVEALAREMGYSVSHFSRTFAAVTGVRPQEFAIHARVDRARELLATTSLSVGEVAAAVGFAEIFYFSRLFKQRTGTTPSEFRRNLLSSGG